MKKNRTLRNSAEKREALFLTIVGVVIIIVLVILLINRIGFYK